MSKPKAASRLAETSNEDIVEAPGLALMLALEALAEEMKNRAAVLRANLNPAFSMYWVDAARKTNDETVAKTFRTEDRTAHASIQLKVKANAALSKEAVRALGDANIGLKVGQKTLAFNSDYAKDKSLLVSLKTLAADPKNSLPSDLVVEEDAVTTTNGDVTLMEVLRRPAKEAVDLLRHISTISVVRGTVKPSSIPGLIAEAVREAGDDDDLANALRRFADTFGLETPASAVAMLQAAPVQAAAAVEPSMAPKTRAPARRKATVAA